MASVAREGDVTPTVGATPYTGAQQGTWTAKAVSYTAYAKLVAGGARAISQAQCEFDFAGTNSSGGAVTGSETLTLSARATTLQHGAAGVILDGDSTASSYGNTLTAGSAAKLRSA